MEPRRFHPVIRERALVAKKRIRVRERQEALRNETLHVSLDKTGALIDGMTAGCEARAEIERGWLNVYWVGLGSGTLGGGLLEDFVDRERVAGRAGFALAILFAINLLNFF